ncbi:MAG: hypothetical protein ACLP50_21155 [Solirubrobacteraceae bacterium]
MTLGTCKVASRAIPDQALTFDALRTEPRFRTTGADFALVHLIATERAVAVAVTQDAPTGVTGPMLPMAYPTSRLKATVTNRRGEIPSD